MDENEIQGMLDEALKNELQKLNNRNLDDDEITTVIARIRNLHELHVEELKAQNEVEDKALRRNMEVDVHDNDERFRLRQERSEKLDRWLKLGMGILELGLPLAFYGAWMKMGFEFEENGAIVSGTFKNLIKFFKPTKKA